MRHGEKGDDVLDVTSMIFFLAMKESLVLTVAHETMF